MGRVFAQNAQSSGFKPQHCLKLDMVAHNGNLSTWEVEAGGSEVYGHPQLYSKFEASLGYMRPYVNNTTTQDVTAALWGKKFYSLKTGDLIVVT